MNGHRGTLTTAVLVLALCAGVGWAQPAAPQGGSAGTTAATSASAPVAPAAAQSKPSSAQSAIPQPGAASAAKDVPEISTQEATDTTFKVKVNLVEVRAVVLDEQGRAVGNLKQEDFQLFDNGKPQVISRFSVETAGTKPVIQPGTSPEIAGEKPAGHVAVVMPQRYIAYLFDDIHVQSNDLAQVRAAAERNLATLQPTDRMGIFTTSGQNQLDFTDDQTKLREAMNRLLPRPVAGSSVGDCPNISYYMADQIVNKNDAMVVRIVTQQAAACNLTLSGNELRGLAQRALAEGGHETQVTLAALKNVVRRIAAMPGRRTILLLSPGFLNFEQLQEQAGISELALHSSIAISALDARGLYTVGYEAKDQMSSVPQNLQYQTMEATAAADVLAEIAHDTGGTFIQKSNDLEGGLRKLATPPEYSYLLGFSPLNLKYDGKFHKLKVTAKGPEKLNVQARKGYYAPKQAGDATAQAKQEIQDEVFSQEEVHDIPLQMHTQFFKTDEGNAKLSLVIRLDVKHLHYRKAEGRNQNSLTVVSALFDRNGNYVSGNRQVLNMKWKDETLENKLGSGVTLKSNFDVKPGSYLVRLVVRDEDGQLAAQNGAVEIP